MRFLLDANIPRSSLEIFKELGLKSTHVTDVNLGGATDEEILAYANKHKSVVVTRDIGFGTLAVFSKVPAYGIIVLRLPYSFNAISIKAALKTFLTTIKVNKLAHSLVMVELDRYRIRKL